MPPVVAALNTSVEPCWEETCGDMLEVMARITPAQPNDAMARNSSRRNRTISLDPNLPGPNSREKFFRRRFKIVIAGSNRFEKRIGREKGVRCDHQSISQSVSQADYTILRPA
jgi:hypothetical protein